MRKNDELPGILRAIIIERGNSGEENKEGDCIIHPSFSYPSNENSCNDPACSDKQDRKRFPL
jgi:hypothetical protein